MCIHAYTYTWLTENKISSCCYEWQILLIWLMNEFSHMYGSDVYGVASISRLLKIIGLFCKRALKNRWNSAKETFNFKAPTNRSHPVVDLVVVRRNALTYSCDMTHLWVMSHVWIRHVVDLVVTHSIFIYDMICYIYVKFVFKWYSLLQYICK